MFIPADSGRYTPTPFAATDEPVDDLPNGLAKIIGRIAQHGPKRPKLSAEERGRAAGYAAASGDMNEQLAVVAHELRNFVCVIRHATRLLEISDHPPPVSDIARGVIERQVKQMARLIDDLLEISVARSGRLLLQRERVDLRVVAQQVVEGLESEIGQRKQRLTVAMPEAPVWLQADPVRLAQILTNLLRNGTKYTDSGGRLWLSIERKADDAIIVVRDTGIGIAADDLPHVFEPFVRVEASSSRCETGHGIGLALVNTLVELHGGVVTAASAGLGQGSEFTIRLPAISPLS